VCADCELRICWAGLQKCEVVQMPNVAGTGLRQAEREMVVGAARHVRYHFNSQHRGAATNLLC